MVRTILHTELNITLTELILHQLACTVHDADNKDVRNDVVSIVHLRELYSRIVLKQRDIQVGDMAALRSKLRLQALQLYLSDGGEDIAHVVTIALIDNVEHPAALTGIAFLRVLLHTEQAGIADFLDSIRIGSNDSATFTRCDILYTVEAEADYIAERANAAPQVLTAERVGGILYKTEIMLACKLLVLVDHIAVAGIIYRHHSRSLRCYSLLGVLKIESQSLRVDVTAYRMASRAGYSLK